MLRARLPAPPLQALGAIVAGAAVALVELYAALTLGVYLLEPTDAPRHLTSLGALLPGLGAVALLYFAAASLAAKRASQPRSTLIVGAITVGTVCGLWFTVGVVAGGVLEILLTALVSSAVLSASLLHGSEALHRIGRPSHRASEA